MTAFDERRRDLKAAEDAEYRREVAHWDMGYEDGEAGRPDRTAEMGSYADDYASGYESAREPLAERF